MPILGIFSSYGQSQRFIEGSFIYDGLDWYIQDNWKVNPQADLRLRPALRAPGRRSTTSSASPRTSSPIKWTRRRRAVPVRAGLRRRQPVHGQQPAGDGSAHEHAARPGHVIAHRHDDRRTRAMSPTASDWRAMESADRAYHVAGSRRWAPRFGGAYDVTGRQQMVVRGSIGLFFDRPDGNTVFSTVANPPLVDEHDVAVGLARRARREPPLVRPGADGAGVLLRLEAAVRHAVEPRVPDGAAVLVVDRRLVRRPPLLQRARRPAEWQRRSRLNTIDFGATLKPSGQDPDAGARHARCRTTCCGPTADTTRSGISGASSSGRTTRSRPTSTGGSAAGSRSSVELDAGR